MEFIFELFAEILGRAEDSLMTPAPKDETAKETEAALQEQEAEPGAQEVNIFNVVNFH